MTRTPRLPPTDKGMWRKVLALAHPDSPDGDHNTFIWVTALREHVTGDAIEEPKHRRPRRTTNAESARVPFETDVSFDDLTERALRIAEDLSPCYGRFLRLLEDCREARHGRMAEEGRRGASYKRLAATAHVAGLIYEQRQRLSRIAERVPLMDRHVNHMLTRLKEGA